MGIQILYPGEDAGCSKELNFDIVAIHGLEGDPINTRTYSDSEPKTCWLRDLLPKQIQNGRIMTFGYDADAAFSRTTSDIDDHGSSLLVNLIDEREANDEKQRPIIFIAHSLGGIILKKALVQSFLEPRYMSIHKFTVGIIFMGTPHQGSDVPEFAKILANVAKKLLLHQNPKATADALQSNSSFLQQLSKDFRNQMSNYMIVSCYEQMPVKPLPRLVSLLLVERFEVDAQHSDECLVVKIVEKYSALLDVANEEQIPVYADHQGMCKFQNERDETYKQIYMRIRRMMQAYEERLRSLQFQTSEGTNVHYSIPYHVSPDFMGRDDILRQMSTVCLPRGPQHSQSFQKRYVLFGLGGSGKTQVCLKFAQDHRERFWGIFYLDASTDNNADSGFLDIADCCDLKACDSQRTRRWLSNQKHPWLLILDNADDPAMNIPKYFPGGTRGTILITTRNPDLKKLATVGSNELGCMDLEDAASLLLKASELDHPPSDASKALAKEIAETLGCLALAIVHAAALVRQRICGLEEYTEIFSKHRQRLLSNNSGRLPRAECDVYATWNVSREAVQSIGNTSSAIALELLNVFACFHFGGISEQIFHSAWNRRLVHANEPDHRQDRSQHLFNKVLGRLRLYDGLPTQSWNPLAFREAIHLLYSFSLISYAKAESGILLHPLINAWARDHLDKKAFVQWSTGSLILLDASIGRTDLSKESYHVKRQWLAHVDACTQKSGDLETLDDDDLRARLTADFSCCRMYQGHGQIHKAYDLAFRGVKLAVMRWGYLNFFTLYSMRVLANQFQAMGELERALETYANITKYVLRMPHQEFPREILDLELLEQEAKCHYARGRFEVAIRRQEPVVKHRIEVDGKENHQTIVSMALLVNMYRAVDREEDGIKLGKDVFPYSKTLRGDDDIGTHLSAHGLATDYKKIGRTSQSLEMLTWQSDTYLSSTSPTNTERLDVLHTLVRDFYDIGHKEKARALAAILATSSEKTLGREHLQTQKRFRMVDWFAFWAQVNAEAVENDEPISSEFLDRLAIMSSEIIRPIELKADEIVQQEINRRRKDLKRCGSKGQVDPEVRVSVLEWMKVRESNSLVWEAFVEPEPQVEPTMYILDGEKSMEDEIREALGPEKYAELEREVMADPRFQNWNAEPKEDDEAEEIAFMSREKISQWLAD